MSKNEYCFGEIVLGTEGLMKGPFGSDLKKSLFVSKGKDTYKVFTQENVLQQKEDVGSYYISEEYFKEKMSRYEVQKGDFLVTCDGTLGKIYQIKELKEKGIISPSLLRIRLDKGIVDETYFLHYFRGYLADALIGRNTNSCLAHMPGLGVIKKEIVEIPDIYTQKRIGMLLNLLEDKITLDKKIIKEIEDMVRGIFEYWFIQFDFPNQDGKPYKATNGKMIYNKALGRDIPEGWSDQNISSLGEIISGGTPKTSCPEYYSEKEIAWITPKDLSNTTDMYISHGKRDITEEGLNNSSAKLMPEGSVLLSTRAPIGYLGIAINPVSTNQGFKSIVPKQPYSSEFIYYMLKANVEGISNQGSGTTFQEVSKETLSNFKVICPPEEVLKKYDQIMAPLTKKRMIVEAEIKELTELRDFLRPLLMNGQVQVMDDLYKEDEEMSKILAELRVAEEEVAATE